MGHREQVALGGTPGSPDRALGGPQSASTKETPLCFRRTVVRRKLGRHEAAGLWSGLSGK